MEDFSQEDAIITGVLAGFVFIGGPLIFTDWKNFLRLKWTPESMFLITNSALYIGGILMILQDLKFWYANKINISFYRVVIVDLVCSVLTI